MRAVLARSGLDDADGGGSINICAALDALQPGNHCMQVGRSVTTVSAQQ
jgi:hypothetical protein